MSEGDGSDDDEYEVYRGPKMGYKAPKERARFVAKATVQFFGSPFIPKDAGRETIHRWVQGGMLAVSSKSARLDIQVETSAAEVAGSAIGAGAVAAAGGHAHSRVSGRNLRVRLRRDRVERVVVDVKNRRVAIKASAEQDDGEIETGWFGMAIRSFPPELIPALKEAFGDKVEMGPLKTDQTRALIMLAVLLAIVVLGLVAYRPF